jgi:hypothetical protein
VSLTLELFASEWNWLMAYQVLRLMTLNLYYLFFNTISGQKELQTNSLEDTNAVFYYQWSCGEQSCFVHLDLGHLLHLDW